MVRENIVKLVLLFGLAYAKAYLNTPLHYLQCTQFAWDYVQVVCYDTAM